MLTYVQQQEAIFVYTRLSNSQAEMVKSWQVIIRDCHWFQDLFIFAPAVRR